MTKVIGNQVYAGGAGPDNDGNGSSSILLTRTMPTPNANNFNKVYLFTGITNANYTHGVIYENQKTATYSATVDFDPTTISCTGSDFIDLISTYISNVSEIKSGTLRYIYGGDLWLLTGLDSDGNVVGSFQIYTGDYEDAGWTMPQNPQDNDVVNFECVISESSASYKWVALNS